MEAVNALLTCIAALGLIKDKLRLIGDVSSSTGNSDSNPVGVGT